MYEKMKRIEYELLKAMEEKHMSGTDSEYNWSSGYIKGLEKALELLKDRM